MLPDTEVPFPQVGAYCVWQPTPADEPQLARIQFRTDAAVKIALPLAGDGSSAFRSVPFGELLDCTPLAPAELRDLDAMSAAGLAASVAGRTPRRDLGAARRKRYAILAEREARGWLLAGLLERLRRRRRQLSRAA